MSCFRRCFMGVNFAVPTAAFAGMPATLPTPFTKDKYPHVESLNPLVDERLQALSFFLLVFFLSAACVKWLWNFARHDWPNLPRLTYKRALGFTFIWGLVAIVVLTMISGARELMTPGAWRKQGWTYKLPAATPEEPHFRKQRRASLEQLRLALMSHAALHDGNFPAEAGNVDAQWAIPAHPGFEFMYRTGQRPSSSGNLLVFEPEIGEVERFVLLTNGMIGTMRTSEIEAIFGKEEHHE